MNYAPMTEGGGGNTIITTHNLGEVGNLVTITAGKYVKIDLTPPETGYFPVGWCVSQRYSLFSGSFVYMNGYIRNIDGYALALGNCGTTDITGLRIEIKILWVKE